MRCHRRIVMASSTAIALGDMDRSSRTWLDDDYRYEWLTSSALNVPTHVPGTTSCLVGKSEPSLWPY
jgi:hypothetical protein